MWRQDVLPVGGGHTCDVGSSYYERIGVRYSTARRPDRRIADLIFTALGDADPVVNVGAGTGSYEPTGRRVVAVEPSQVMLGLRAPSAALAVQAMAESLPFPNSAFQAAMAVLTLHHWWDPVRGLGASSGGQQAGGHPYDRSGLRSNVLANLPILSVDRRLGCCSLSADRRRLFEAGRNWGHHACADPQRLPRRVPRRFLAATDAYLDPGVQAGISTFMLIGQEERRRGERLLGQELENGEWHRRFGHLLELDELDVGYRLVTAQL
jgi:hypothetical protein